MWQWPWLEVMSLKSSGHGGFESKYQREGKVSWFVPWVFFFFFFFFFFWLLGIEGGVGCGGYGRGRGYW